VTRASGAGAQARLFRVLMYGLILASAAAQFALVPVMPVYAHRFGLSGFQQGMVLGATGLASLAVSVPAGTLSDRFGARRITLAAGLLMAAGTLAQALADGFPALLASRPCSPPGPARLPALLASRPCSPPGPARLPARLRRRLRRGVDRRPVLARRCGRRPVGPRRIGG
jgi:MFS family permease